MAGSTDKKRNLLINGFGTSSGGHFEKAEVNGKGTVNGDVYCNEIICNGFATINGNVEAQTIKINGNGKIDGNVYAQEISVDGIVKMSGEVNGGELKVSGSAAFGNNVKGDSILVNGKAKIAGDCESENFSSEGIFRIGGLLNAEEISVLLYGECKAEEIGGKSIIVKEKPSGMMKLIKPFFPSRLVTKVMEGDDIRIEAVTADVVRGNTVAIGPNCEIGLVEYKSDIQISPGSKVKEHKKIL
ncbi:polymer-forming cytoskeletal protein [Heyndrickxia acidicola]|uniref:Polymer-forming cytoskeletal protein n=1 Tax=Heyndrickxia acidicola TaxID=209389 RepID=A0ABU6ME68_9BACI|nr:polymer-forming cytoskeletal protein [Heyndrickxia acidicola]MED1202951.1 polymer-forming cytoskeletal protein [Heyndrickxia acidicola]